MEFKVSFENLNDAVEKLDYVRVYQSPVDKSNVFNIEVTHGDGNYNTLKNLIKLAEKEGYKYNKYYEMSDPWGDYHYTAEMYSDEFDVECSYDQNKVYKMERE